MQILLADAKIMHEVPVASPLPLSVPAFDDTARRIADEMSHLDVAEMAAALKCSGTIAAQNRLRFEQMPHAPRHAAILTYNGHAYKHLKAGTLDAEALSFAQRHVWITGFLYGVLRPLDGIVPYRMEQGITLDATGGMPVNRFWRATGGATQIVLDSVAADDGVLVHLSTTEFESIFDMKRLSSEARLVQPMFYVSTGGRLAVQAVWARRIWHRLSVLRYLSCCLKSEFYISQATSSRCSISMLFVEILSMTSSISTKVSMCLSLTIFKSLQVKEKSLLRIPSSIFLIICTNRANSSS